MVQLLEQFHSHETCYHFNKSLSQFKTNKNGAYAKPRANKGRQERKKQEKNKKKKQTNKQKNTFVRAKGCLSY